VIDWHKVFASLFLFTLGLALLLALAMILTALAWRYFAPRPPGSRADTVTVPDIMPARTQANRDGGIASPQAPAPEDWYARHDCQHAHCPQGCDEAGKAQPVQLSDGNLYCGRCAALHQRTTLMVPCHPSTCSD